VARTASPARALSSEDLPTPDQLVEAGARARRHRHDRKPDGPQGFEERQVVRIEGKILLVADEQRRDAGLFRTGEVAIDDEWIAGRAGRNDHSELVEVGGERLAAAAAVAAAEDVFPWQPLDHRPLVVARGNRDTNLVAGHEVEIASLELAGDVSALTAGDDDPAAVGLDDAARVRLTGHGVDAAGRARASSFPMRTAGGGCESWNAE